ncbi:glycosyltransferase [Elizabethkingia ursingii]|uniref:glycosyltransferase family 2 protein n=1 Tax=Elizabethkingia ursingii TaxID=1756150 RepID=UPI00201141CE|nr:glycosyltransferase family 2 protein [Elizabethkingia ursingii]MCL1665346.1 glycosyltransferase [Elizabethkingia ursingii]
MLQENPLVSIIVPVYNAESTLYIALDSIISQSYQHLEVILIDDCSQDNTLDVIDRYTVRLSNQTDIIIKVISHEHNKGVAGARNTGLNNATGDYIYYVDADDYIERDAIEIMAKEAIETEADIIGCNWYLSFSHNERKMNQSSFETPVEAIQKILSGKMRWNLWLFMVRRSLYEEYNIRFLDGMNMGEDMMAMVKLFINAKKVSYIDKALYHYGQSNEGSLTKTYSERHRKEVIANLNSIEVYLQKSAYSGQFDEKINFLKLNIKLPLLISDEKDNYKIWLKWFPEANPFIMRNKDMLFRTRLLQWMAMKRQYWFLKLYYNIVIRYIYGIIYK